MARQQRPRWAVEAAAVLVLLAAAAVVSARPAADSRVETLRSLEASAKDGVIVMNEGLFNDLALSADRPYQLVFFGSARRHMDSPKLQLRKLRQEFTYAAKAFKAGADADKVFFVDMWHDDSSAVFQRLGLNALPAIWHWGPAQGGKAGKKIPVPDAAKCGSGIQAYPWPAEAIADFVKSRTSLSHAPIDRPSFVKSPLFPVAAAAFLAAGGLAAWKLYNSPIVRMTWLWGLGALAVYGFSTSGGMYNIIRGMPMYVLQPGGKVRWWLEGRQGQLGAEGFMMGSSYIVFSATISLMAYGLPHIKNERVRSGASLVAALLAAAVCRGIFMAYMAKTGMSMRSFFL